MKNAPPILDSTFLFKPQFNIESAANYQKVMTPNHQTMHLHSCRRILPIFEKSDIWLSHTIFDLIVFVVYASIRKCSCIATDEGASTPLCILGVPQWTFQVWQQRLLFGQLTIAGFKFRLIFFSLLPSHQCTVLAGHMPDCFQKFDN